MTYKLLIKQHLEINLRRGVLNLTILFYKMLFISISYNIGLKVFH